jgi:hypothetical protein
MPQGSDGRYIHVGLVGPKPRLGSVGDGQPVNIPVPAEGVDTVRPGKGQPLSGLRWQGVHDPDAEQKGEK